MPLKKIQPIFTESNFKKVEKLYKIEKLYTQTVNGPLAEISTPYQFSNGILYVAVRTSSWIQELSFYKHKIIARIEKQGLKVKDLKFVLKEDFFKDIKTESERIIKSNNLSKEQKTEIKDILAETKDKSLKKRLEGILEKDKLNKSLKDKKSLKCPICGGDTEIFGKPCVSCVNIEKDKQNKDIRIILDDTPWIKYESLEKNQQEKISKDQFLKEKRFYCKQLYDRIKQGSYELFNNHSIQLKNTLQQLSLKLVLLTTNEEPKKLTDKQFEAILGAKVYKIIYK